MATRRYVLALSLGLPALLAGCGWEPLYANHESDPVNAELRQILVSPIVDRLGQRLEFALRDSFNPTTERAEHIYRLQVALSTTFSDLGIQSQGLGTRGEVQVYATYHLFDIASGEQLQTDTIHTIDSFDIQANGYSTVVAQEDAFKRCGEEIRREIVGRLTLFLQGRKATAAS
jgi:LPS-assembly lipoprotein